MKVSIIIPARNELFLPKMVDELFRQACGDIEVIVVQDGPPYTPLTERRGLTVVYGPQKGLKPCVNQAASLATGKYLLKSDAHCMFARGFDEVLQADCEPNWIVIPRLYILDAENWRWQDDRFYDYFFLCCPLTDKRQYRFQAGGHWRQRTLARLDVVPLDETLQFQGSAWFLERDFFIEKLGGMSSVGYDTFGMEPPELGLKTWLGPWGGRVMVNKGTWYAHMHKGRERPRGYSLSAKRIWDSYDYCARYWMTNQWLRRAHDIGWLIDKFMPIPGWPENWRELQADWEAKHA